MRIPTYMSPTSLKTFESNTEEYYLRYLAEDRPARPPQTKPMSVGSAFDAKVKSYIHYALYGHYGDDDKYKFENIFEQQVEEHNQDWAYVAGQIVFDRYKSVGALADLMLELKTAIGEARFEFDIQGLVSGEAGTVPLLGKPDIFFINDQGARVILDWKVNGYCSQASPTKGYVRAFGGRRNGMAHPHCVTEDHLGIQINGAYNLEQCSAMWADQLATYAWLLGETVGSEQLVSGLDQITKSGKGELVVTKHRSIIGQQHQFELLGRYCYAWGCITGGHFFKDRPLADSLAHCKYLDKKAKALAGGDQFSRFLNAVRQ